MNSLNPWILTLTKCVLECSESGTKKQYQIIDTIGNVKQMEKLKNCTEISQRRLSLRNIIQLLGQALLILVIPQVENYPQRSTFRMSGGHEEVWIRVKPIKLRFAEGYKNLGF